MALELYAHPFSSFCQKALVALYENGTPFDYVMLSPENPSAIEKLQSLWPMGKFPMLVDEGRPIHEATIIIEHLQA
jgi:glutathione S-transferase